MSDEHEGGGSGGGHGGGGGHGAGHDVGEVAEGIGGIAEGIGSMIPGDEEGEHEPGHESDAQKAKEVVEGIAKGAETAAKAAEGLDKLGSGVRSGNFSNVGSGVGGLADAARYVVPEGQAREVLAGVGQVARGAGTLIEGARGVVDRLGGAGGGGHGEAANNTRYHVEIEGVDSALHVRSLHYEDAIGQLPTVSVEVACERDTFLEEAELFGKDVHVSLERGEEQRSLRGMVRRSFVHHGREEQLVHLEVVPALWMLSQTQDSRVYQHLSVPELVQKLFQEYLEPEHRKVRLELTEDYPVHEYLVQHRESHQAFVARLLDEEGIWFYFDHDSDDHETMVLCDSNENRPRIREDHDGQLQYSTQENASQQSEVAFHMERRRWMGSTDYVATGYDWTNPGAAVRHERVERGEWRGPPLEVHEHFHNVRHHDYDEGAGQYRAHSGDRVSRMQTERLDLRRGHWTLHTSAIGVRPGHTFELVGADEHDGRYLIVRVSAGGNPGATSGGFHATLDIIPYDMPYRPPAPERPLMPGPETATVVGPAGEEIHTDKHGRIKVQFHWDRRGERNEHSSAWIRVQQAWAGPGWGTMFIPRIGMEVIVSFLGGDPDRPIVTGCVYNGQNPVPYQLPDHKTRSTLKTNSSTGGGGYNELRFEDKAGNEEVWIHAQKDFNEVVEHDHTTHVKHDQRNTVDHDHTETIGNDQELHVKKFRTKTVDRSETTTIGEDRDELVQGSESVVVDHKRMHHIKEDDNTVVDQHRTTKVGGKYTISSTDHYKVTQNAINELYIKDCIYGSTTGRIQFKAGEGEVFYDAHANGLLNITATGEMHLEADQKMFHHSKQSIKIQADQKVIVEAETEITLLVGASVVKLTNDGIEIIGPTVKINATSGATEIDAASQVKIKC